MQKHTEVSKHHWSMAAWVSFEVWLLTVRLIQNKLHKTCHWCLYPNFLFFHCSPTCHKDDPQGDSQGNTQRPSALHLAFPSFEEWVESLTLPIRVCANWFPKINSPANTGKCGWGLKPGVLMHQDLWLSEGKGAGGCTLIVLFSVLHQQATELLSTRISCHQGWWEVRKSKSHSCGS